MSENDLVLERDARLVQAVNEIRNTYGDNVDASFQGYLAAVV